MGLLERLTGPIEKRGTMTSYSQVGALGTIASSGVYVSDATSLSCSSVYACVRLLAESVAVLPLHVYERLSNGGRRRADEHPLSELLRDEMNPLMSAFVGRETMQGHLGVRGNAYALIERRGRTPVALWPLRPDRMTAVVGELEDGSSVLSYRYQRVSAGAVDLDPDDVVHVQGLGGDGITGLSPVTLHRQAIGLAMATEEAGSRFFGNAARPSGTFTHPTKLSDDAYARLKASIEQANAGLENTGKIILLEEGVTWSQIGLSNEDSQYLETRAFQVQDIARIYRIPPNMIGAASGDSMTYANVEQQSLAFVQYTLLPWLVRWEQELGRKLLTKSERERYYIRFNVDGLLRADLKTRYDAYKVGIEAGFLMPNEARQKEDLDPKPGLDEPRRPAAPAPAPAAPVSRRTRDGGHRR